MPSILRHMPLSPTAWRQACWPQNYRWKKTRKQALLIPEQNERPTCHGIAKVECFLEPAEVPRHKSSYTHTFLYMSRASLFGGRAEETDEVQCNCPVHKHKHNLGNANHHRRLRHKLIYYKPVAVSGLSSTRKNLNGSTATNGEMNVAWIYDFLIVNQGDYCNVILAMLSLFPNIYTRLYSNSIYTHIIWLQCL